MIVIPNEVRRNWLGAGEGSPRSDLVCRRGRLAIVRGGYTSLGRRIYEHKHRLVPGFSSKYFLERLVYFEDTDDIGAAIAREKQLKGLAPLEENRPDTQRESRIVGPQS